MDKVIIDRVDVSECDNLAILQDRMTDKEFTFCNAYQEDCSERENCHYKQLQRLKHQYADVLKLAKENADSNEYCLQELEQENKKLKRLLETKCESELDKENSELKAENERLKARLRPLEDSYFKGLSSIEIAELAKKSIRVTAENRKLEYALQEIKDIVSEPCIVDENCQTCNSGCMQKDILAKINKVIGAEE